MAENLNRIDRRHIDHTVATRGQWVGLCDSEGWPVAELAAVVSISSPEAYLAVSSCEVTVLVDAESVAARLLIGDGLRQDDEGRIIPSTDEALLLVVCRQGARDAFPITHCTAPVAGELSRLTIHGTSLIDMLDWWPCPSVPLSWTEASFEAYSTDASGVEYNEPRRLAPVEFATKADGYTVRGPAGRTIRKLIYDSIFAVNDVCGWAGDPHMVVAAPTGEDSGEEVVIRVTDDTVWETINEPARNAGVAITARLWWPGDGPVDHEQYDTDGQRSTQNRTFTKPMVLVSTKS